MSWEIVFPASPTRAKIIAFWIETASVLGSMLWEGRYRMLASLSFSLLVFGLNVTVAALSIILIQYLMAAMVKAEGSYKDRIDIREVRIEIQ